jgi:hypothetical protein|tara:strand:- start:1208 stop:1381 length:174 start_codon:yes stop_codon:yes gene_type:complete
MTEVQEDRKKQIKPFQKSWVSTPSRIKWSFVPESLPTGEKNQETEERNGEDEQSKGG